MSIYDWMIFKLYARPFMLLVASVLSGYYSNSIGQKFSSNKFLAPLGAEIASYSIWVSGGLFALSLAFVAYSSWRLWRWSQGNSDQPSCHNCGGLVDMKDGRYGLYYRCLACGKTRSI